MKEINWYSVEVGILNISHTEKNYKIANALGRERLKQSLKSFGIAGNVVCNWSGKMGDIKKLDLVDGNSRLDEAIEKQKKKLWVSVPDRKLTPKEFQEMSSMFDASNAGDVDMERIKGDLGKTKDWYDKWNLGVPKHLLDKLGAKQQATYKKEKESKKAETKVTADKNLNERTMIQLLFSTREAEEYRALEEKLSAKLRTKGTNETALVCMKELAKLLKIK